MTFCNSLSTESEAPAGGLGLGCATARAKPRSARVLIRRREKVVIPSGALASSKTTPDAGLSRAKMGRSQSLAQRPFWSPRSGWKSFLKIVKNYSWKMLL